MFKPTSKEEATEEEDSASQNVDAKKMSTVESEKSNNDGFLTFMMVVPTPSPTMLADAGVYLGEDYGDVYGAEGSQAL